MQKNVLARLRSIKPSLSPTLLRIAVYVLKRPEDVIYQTITEVADQSSSNEASVLRFCRSLGFSSFQRFKMALAMELTANRAAPPTKPTSDVVEKSFASAMATLQHTKELLDRADAETVAKRLAKARSIDLYALGASSNVARYAVYRFICLGLTSRMFDDPNLAVMSAVRLGEKDVAIAISASGSTKDTAGVSMAEQKGTTVAV